MCFTTMSIATRFSIPRGMIMSISFVLVSSACFCSDNYSPEWFRCGSTWRWKFGFTNEIHCLIHPSTSLPLSLTSRMTLLCFRINNSLTESQEFQPHFFVRDRGQRLPQQKFSCLAILKLSDHIVQIFPLK